MSDVIVFRGPESRICPTSLYFVGRNHEFVRFCRPESRICPNLSYFVGQEVICRISSVREGSEGGRPGIDGRTDLEALIGEPGRETVV